MIIFRDFNLILHHFGLICAHKCFNKAERENALLATLHKNFLVALTFMPISLKTRKNKTYENPGAQESLVLSQPEVLYLLNEQS